MSRDSIILKAITAKVQERLADGWEAHCYYMGQFKGSPRRAFVNVQSLYDLPFTNLLEYEGFDPEKLANLSPIGIEKTADWIIGQVSMFRKEAVKG